MSILEATSDKINWFFDFCYENKIVLGLLVVFCAVLTWFALHNLWAVLFIGVVGLVWVGLKDAD